MNGYRDQKDIGALVYEAVKLGLGNAASGSPPDWLPFALDALLREETESSNMYALLRKEARDAEKVGEDAKRRWCDVGAYIHAAKDAGYLKPLVRQADEGAADMLDRGILEG